MKSRHAWLFSSLALSIATSSVLAQPAAPDKPASVAQPAPTSAPTTAPVPAPVAQPAASAVQPATPIAPIAAPVRARRVPARPPLTAPAQVAAPTAQAPVASPATLPPPRFQAARAPTVVYRAPPVGARKRRYGNAGAPFTLAVGGSLRFRSEHGYRQLHAQGLQREFEVSASYDVFQPVRRLVIAAGLDYRLALLGDYDSLEVATDAIQADVIVRYTAATWLFPQLRAGIGAQLARAELRDESADFRARGRSASAAGSIGAGLLVQTPRRLFETYNGHLSSLVVGLLVEGGYAFAGDADFKLKVKSESDLPKQPIALGKLALGGPYLRIAGVVRF